VSARTSQRTAKRKASWSAKKKTRSAEDVEGQQEAEVGQEGEIPPEVIDLFGTLREEALRRLDEFAPIHLFSLCWAYSTARLLDDSLQQTITDAALRIGADRDANPRPAKHGRENAAAPSDATQDGSSDRAVDSMPSSDIAAIKTAQDNSDLAAKPGLVGQAEPGVLLEGEHWLALYKPPFWHVNVDSKEAAKAAAAAPFEDDDDGDFDDVPVEFQKRAKVQLWIKQFLASKYPICTDAIEAFGLMHRLDAQTSGVLLCAKSYVGSYWLRLQWCSYRVDKEYVCLVHGWVDRGLREIYKRIRIDKKRAANSRRTVATHCKVSPSGKPSYTEVFTLAHLTRPAEGLDAESQASERYSLVVLKLHTGRTHQIRVHMENAGHPLVTDIKYAEQQFPADRTWCPRNFLHTYHLGFDDVPSSSEAGENKTVDVYCPLPDDLRDVLSQLKPVDEVSAEGHNAWLSANPGDLRSFDDWAPPLANTK